MSDQRTRKYRSRKAAEQHQHCYYCGFPMWGKRPEGFARHYGISVKEAQQFRCTAEHLQARCDGGTACLDNIVAACWFCNSRRHLRSVPLTADAYLKLVQGRVEQFAWHPPWLHKMVGRRYLADAPGPNRVLF
jgi:hypothetical protein